MKIQNPNKKLLSTKIIFSIFIILLITLTGSALFEYKSRRKSALDLMSHMSQNLARSIETAAVHSILNYDQIVGETNRRLEIHLEMLKHLDSENRLSNEFLKQYAKDNNIHRINVFMADSKKALSSHDSHFEIQANPMIHSVLSGKTDFEVFGIQAARGESGDRFIAAIHRSKGGAIVINIDAAELIAVQRERGIASLINAIVADSSVQYIAIQDSLGIIAATSNVESLSSFSSDSFLPDALEKNEFRHRITQFIDFDVYEGLMPFTILDASYGLIRIGIDIGPLEVINQSAIRNAIIRMAILLLITFILMAYLFVTQNYRLLAKEKDNITNEVYRLQEDLRRREKLSAMGELAAGVAHEIRNPLNAISMSIQRLGREIQPDEGSKQAGMITSIRKEIQRVSDIIHQFLEFARPAPLHKNRQALNPLIENIVAMYQAKASGKQIELNWIPGKVAEISIDAEKISQVIINLLENAIDACEQAGTITIQTKKIKKQVQISVQDTGKGISEEDRAKIFNLYFTTKPNGNGLGLSLVYQIISEHNGRIDVNSEPGKGTAFTITLPNE